MRKAKQPSGSQDSLEAKRDETLSDASGQTPPDRKKTALLNRRDLLKIGGLTAAAAVVTQVVITGPLSADAVQGIGPATHTDNSHAGGSSAYEWHMAIDLDRCIGCNYCVKTCQAVNDVPDDEMQWNIVFPERTELGVDFYMNRPCQHCQEAPCTRVCPVGATWVREDGVVVMDYDRCIGCRYCQVACPYDVRRFNWRISDEPNPNTPKWGTPEVERRPRGVVEKCTFCIHRINRGLAQGLMPGIDPAATPACVAVCPVGARVFGNIKDPQSPVSQYLAEHDTFRLREEWGTQPKVHYVRPGNGRS
jgi:Fe-S-cluster-containing dehydrogenase component